MRFGKVMGQMERGVFSNLFEVSLPTEKMRVMEKEWNRGLAPSIAGFRQSILPTYVFASEHTNKLCLFGPNVQDTAEKHGFAEREFAVGADPRFTGRLILDAVTRFLTLNHGFEPQYRTYSSNVKSCEMVKTNEIVHEVERRITVFKSFRLQSLFLKISNELRYFVLINPKVRYRFRHDLEQIQESVDCTGRYIRVNCPTNCNVYNCEIYPHRGRLAGKFERFTDESQFVCRFDNIDTVGSKFVALGDDARFSFPLPLKICELEASIPNIGAIFTARFNAKRASSAISELRVSTGDLLSGPNNTFANTEVGQKRWADIKDLVDLLDAEIPFLNGLNLNINGEPVRAIKGGHIPEEDYYDDEEDVDEGEVDDLDNDIF